MMFSDKEQEFMDAMGISWYEAMYAVMVKKALELGAEIVELKKEIEELKK